MPSIDKAALAELVEKHARCDLSRALYARALEKMRLAIVNIHDGLEDEGDRIYLGSTNHADDIHAAWHLADALHWDEILADTQPETPLAAVNLELQATIAAQLKTIGEMREALTSVQQSLQLAAPVPVVDRRIAAEVAHLGDRYGYGALMVTASALWRSKIGDLAGGEFVAGPCRSTVEQDLARIDDILSSENPAQAIDAGLAGGS